MGIFRESMKCHQPEATDSVSLLLVSEKVKMVTEGAADRKRGG